MSRKNIRNRFWNRLFAVILAVAMVFCKMLTSFETVQAHASERSNGLAMFENKTYDLIAFENPEVTYILGDNDGQLFYQTAEKTFPFTDLGEVTYTIDKADVGLSCDAESGKICITDYMRLEEKLITEGSVVVTVRADKKKAGEKYPADYAEYILTILLDDIPEESYVIASESEKGKNGWYTKAVTILPADPETYVISNSCNPDSFGENVVYENSGMDYYVYLRNIQTGRITKRIKLEGVKIDREAPSVNSMQIDFLDANLIQRFLSTITFGFYKPSVTICFTAKDTVSGIDYFDWAYTKEDKASDCNEEYCEGRLPVTTGADGTAVAELELTAEEAEEIKQYRGTIAFTAMDKAGLISELKSDNTVFVVDTKEPVCISEYITEAVYTLGDRYYYNADAQVKLSITEANFFADDVVIRVSKDGGEPETVIIWPEEWTADEEIADTYNTVITLSADGEYVVYADYKDRCDNKMKTYQSETIIVDKTKPEISSVYEREGDTQSVSVTIKEHNFQPSDIHVDVNAVDINGEILAVENMETDLQNGEWTTEGDVHTIVLSELSDAIYTLTIHYTDLAMNQSETHITDPFVIDHTAPLLKDMSITYSEGLQEIYEGRLGFYNPLPTKVDSAEIEACPVTITFTAVDSISGIDRFDWTYLREAGASVINEDSLKGQLVWKPEEIDPEKIEIVQNSEDKSIFTATLILPGEVGKQLHGNIAFMATDRCGNKSEKLEDLDYVVVVDSIAPTIKAECDEANRIVESEGETKLYYNQTVKFTFEITEANFFAEDVQVIVMKDGVEAKKAEVTWERVAADSDTYKGILMLNAPQDHSGDGDYIISVSYMDKSNNIMEKYTSDTIVIDTILPLIQVSYSNQNIIRTLKDSDGKERKYFDEVQVANILIKEHNFEVSEVKDHIIAKDVTGKVLDVNALVYKSEWNDNEDLHTMTITYSGDANYIFDIDYIDLAMNEAEDYTSDYFTVDKTGPVNLTISYSESVLDTVLENVTFGFYDAKVKVTITAEDSTSGIYEFICGYQNADTIVYSDSGQKATAVFEIPKEALGDQNQFNGTVEFIAGDRAGNTSEFKDTKRIVVDNIAPSLQMNYNAPVNEEAGISYYDGNINVVLTVTEANFYSQDVIVTVTKDGVAYNVIPSWRKNATDVHVGTFTLEEDGDYLIAVNYKDKSGNGMPAYVSDQLTIDTGMDAPVITINGKEESGKAYKNEVIPAVSFFDENFDDYEITLTRTRYGAKNVDVRETFIGNHMTTNAKGGSGIFDEFTSFAENDGIYNFTVTITDKAGHECTSRVEFTVNRFGSVYEYNDYLISLITGGGAYVSSVVKDLKITEYNADRLVEDSLNIEITRDGKPLDVVKYDIDPIINELVPVGESGWFEYDYTISKDNFMADGVYKIFISSKDATGNKPENTSFNDRNILFRVDSTAPEITSITGLEKSIINAQEVTVNYIVYDTMGLKSIKVLVDGKLLGETIMDFADSNNYEGSFVIKESSIVQQVRLVVEDLAGNIVDTGEESFENAYEFYPDVIVSTNFFVRWYANKPLFFGILGGTVAISAIICKKCRNKLTSH